jgi:hypothetical protein
VNPIGSPLKVARRWLIRRGFINFTSSTMRASKNHKPESEPASSNAQSRMPRALKYAWGLGVTLLVGLSLVLDRGSAWMPLVHRAIDLMQTQTAPIESK